MKKNISILLLICSASYVMGQNIENVLQEVELNNTVLSALKKQVEAEKAGNKSGIYPENPEVEYHYLWGNEEEPGNRTDFSASQRFDFPTSYYHKKKVSDGKNQQVEQKYRIERKNVLLEAKQVCIQLIYQNALLGELQNRLSHAQEIAGAYQKRFDKGEVNILENNKAKLNLLNAQKEINTATAEKQSLEAELLRLNGGKEISFPVTSYDPVPLPSDFKQWYADNHINNSLLQYLEQETAINKQNEKLQRSMNLPKLSIGYMSEKVRTEQFQGVTIGMSIPLWENKNTVKQIKAQTIASQAASDDAENRQYNQSKALYEKAGRLNETLITYKEYMNNINSSDLLKKALDAGEISLIEYMTERGIYYETVNYVLGTERDYQLLVAELKEWEL